eukprot:392604-Pyramimonas_sp.AAC.1
MACVCAYVVCQCSSFCWRAVAAGTSLPVSALAAGLLRTSWRHEAKPIGVCPKLCFFVALFGCSVGLSGTSWGHNC